MDRIRGFTLIELLVVLVILGVLATSVAPSLGRWDDRAVAAAAATWRDQAERASRQAAAEGRSWAWEIGPASARLLVRDDAGNWQIQGAAAPLAVGVTVERVEIDGAIAPARGQRVVFSDLPPLFAVTLAGAGERWRIRGDASGYVSLEPGA